MDFFESQARAKKRTSRLVVLFGLAVIGTILASYLAAAVILRQISPRGRHIQASYWEYQRTAQWPDTAAETSWWDPKLFAGVSLGTLVVVALGSLYKWSEFSAGGRAVAESVGGRRVDPHTTDLNERRLLNVVEEMAIASGVPVPAVYLLDQESAINAFAAGLTTSDAVVTVTRGAMEKLSRDELQGVVGHEFSHILNGDMRLNLRIAAIIFGILVLGLAGRGILWSLSRGRIRLRGKAGSAIIVIALAGVALVIIGYIGYFFGRLIQAAVSRQREFLADASSVQFTRNPSGITGALKKIGGYALGSTLQANQSAAISHFFFAQAFATGFTGLWATHPPLDDRIRAIEPQFDGKFFEPPPVAASESFAASSAATPARKTGAVEAALAVSAPLTAVATIGALTSEQLDSAQRLLEVTPARLRTAAQTAAEAQVLLYGLLLDDKEDVRDRQRQLVATHAGADASRILGELEPALRLVKPDHKLPLLQLALPSLRPLSAQQLAPFFDTLDELVHADGRVTPFEFALQKLLQRTLELARTPAAAVVQYYSFNALNAEIALVLSALARASTQDEAAAAQAFATGAAQLKLIERSLGFVSAAACEFTALDTALDKLARASLPIRHRTLLAAAHVVNADGRVLVTEFELLRAIAAALDVPMPPMTVA